MNKELIKCRCERGSKYCTSLIASFVSSFFFIYIKVKVTLQYILIHSRWIHAPFNPYIYIKVKNSQQNKNDFQVKRFHIHLIQKLSLRRRTTTKWWRSPNILFSWPWYISEQQSFNYICEINSPWSCLDQPYQ